MSTFPATARRVPIRAVLAVLCLFAIAACTGDDSPATAPPSTPTPAPVVCDRVTGLFLVASTTDASCADWVTTSQGRAVLGSTGSASVWSRSTDTGTALIVASVVGLGFAVGENVDYYQMNQGHSVFGRFVTANFLHLTLTGLVGHALVQAVQGRIHWEDFLSRFGFFGHRFSFLIFITRRCFFLGFPGLSLLGDALL